MWISVLKFIQVISIKGIKETKWIILRRQFIWSRFYWRLSLRTLFLFEDQGKEFLSFATEADFRRQFLLYLKAI
ncbi:hypothetical protein K2173_022731 [Erythroxylum novogranatense]|uniref:Uncharacterized protein n=1 Tax=Erythroxylum novogranatense TaxID=1862640 RepID=A0AAV8SMM6_9ROSI|nr:hypothetical protein K2173_022731 [Erythroxylum novogranatense]